MSKSILDKLNSHRVKAKPKPKLRRKPVKRARSIPVQDLAIPTQKTIFDTHEFFHREEETIYPKWKKWKLPDYRPGKVRVYSKAEIEQYMKEREDD